MYTFFKKIFNKQALSGFILAMFLFSNILAYTIPSNRAEAQQIDFNALIGGLGTCVQNVIIGRLISGAGDALGGIIGGIGGGGGGDWLSTMFGLDGLADGDGDGEVPTFDDDADVKKKEDNIKNQVVDCLVWTVTQELVGTIAENVIDWVTGGNFGEPYFVRDEIQFYSTLKTSVAERFINEDLFNANLPPAFKNTVIGFVTEDSTIRSTNTILNCDDTTTDLGTFLTQPVNDFAILQAQYDNLFANPACIPLGAYLLADAEKQKRQTAVIEQQRERLAHGDGFLPEIGPAGEVLTPGVNIKDMVQRVIESNVGQLEDADELAELIIEGALDGLVTSIFGTGGSLCRPGFAGGSLCAD